MIQETNTQLHSVELVEGLAVLPSVPLPDLTGQRVAVQKQPAARRRKSGLILNKFCFICGKGLPPHGKSEKYCSQKCRKEHAKILQPDIGRYDHLTSGTVGALQELKVACDLIHKGFQVFRALSPSCDCDMTILKAGKLIRVEVTTGRRNVNGSLAYPAHDESKFDIIAIVASDGIYYFPELPK